MRERGLPQCRESLPSQPLSALSSTCARREATSNDSLSIVLSRCLSRRPSGLSRAPFELLGQRINKRSDQLARHSLLRWRGTVDQASRCDVSRPECLVVSPHFAAVHRPNSKRLAIGLTAHCPILDLTAA